MDEDVILLTNAFAAILHTSTDFFDQYHVFQQASLFVCILLTGWFWFTGPDESWQFALFAGAISLLLSIDYFIGLPFTIKQKKVISGIWIYLALWRSKFKMEKLKTLESMANSNASKITALQQ